MTGRLRELLVLSLVLAGCEEVVTRGSSSASSATVAASASVAAPPSGPALAKVVFRENDFSESDQNRDPFRSFAGMFSEEARSTVKTQRDVVLDQYSLDELKLVGIVTRIQPERALIVDPTGKGHIVRRGQFVGRAELIQGATPAADHEINWRVERIRDADIVLVRDDPAHPEIPTATRIIPLRTDQPAPE